MLKKAIANQGPPDSLPPRVQEPFDSELTSRDPESAEAAAGLVLASHRNYLQAFNALTAKAKEAFENRAWTQGSLDAGERVKLYRAAVNEACRKLQRLFGDRVCRPDFWLAARQVFLDRVLKDYDADLALTLFYSTMRLALEAIDVPVEYADDGLAERSDIAAADAVLQSYRTSPARLAGTIAKVLESCAFRVPFENCARDAAVAAERLLEEWSRQCDSGPPRVLRMLKPVFFRDCEAYLAGKLCSAAVELPVVLALKHEGAGISVDAVLAGKEDMRNILFVSTRSTFCVRTDYYREVIGFLDTLAPERGHPAMCAVLGFTHPARVALNQHLRRHLRVSGERFMPAPGRAGTAMVVFSPPSFPYVFKVIRDFSSKQTWKGPEHIAELYRWVHEMNRGRLMLDAWIYRNLQFSRDAFVPSVLDELLTYAPNSVRLDGDTVTLRQVYAQRRVLPLSTFFEQSRDPALRRRIIDAFGAFIEDLAGMGFFIGDCYGLPFNVGITHGFNIALFDFDDLEPVLRCRFMETPPLPDERSEWLWNTETEGAWFRLGENDVLVDEWSRYLGVPPDLYDYFLEKHGHLFTLPYWDEVRRQLMAGKRHFVLPYPQERRLSRNGTS